MKFPESGIMHAYLDGLKGIEIGAGSHNPFGLDTINVDYIQHGHDTYEGREQAHLFGSVANVDVIADACSLPFDNKSYDFVINSHVFEHMYSPIHALLEWNRVACHYIAIIAPDKDRCGEGDCIETDIEQAISRYNDYDPADPEHLVNRHWTHWKLGSFLALAEYLKFDVARAEDKDDKVGNGWLVVMRAQAHPVKVGG